MTVGTLAAIYFFIVKPATDTANNAFDSFSEPLKQVEKATQDAQQQLQQQSKQGNSGAQVSLSQLQHCVQKAKQNVNKLQRCTEKFAP